MTSRETQFGPHTTDCYLLFQLVEVAVLQALFEKILRRIDRLGPQPPPLPA